MKKLFACLLALVASVLQLPAAAEDIDLFASPPTTVTYLPNVLIIIDNTANWSSAFSNEKAALKAVFDSLPLDRFRVGVMLFSESGGGNGNPDGAYVRAAIRTMNATNRPVYSAWINSLSENGDKGNGRGLGLAMAEAYKYFAAQPAYAGHNKVKRDYPGNTAAAAETDALHALPGNAFSSSTSSSYVNPVQDSCQRNFVIYIGNTTSGGNVTRDNTNDNNAAGTLLAAQPGADTSQVTDISPAGFSENHADEWSRFMKVSPLGITTYTIDVTFGTGGNGLDNSGLLRSMANQGAGKYFRIEAGTTTTLQDDIERAMGLIFSEIQSVNSVFASVSLPVSVNSQGSYLNQVYIGMFRPDIGAAPRWAGNLKQYKLGLVGGNLKLLDANTSSAINNQTGFITECARSFWTPGVVDSYWSFKGWPTGTTFCIPPGGTPASAYRNSNYPDGNVVEKGAQAYQLRSTTARSIYTCGTTMAGCSASTSMVAFNTTNVTAGAIGASSTAERDALVNWAIGLDTLDEDLDGVTTTRMRASSHGDIVHSRPVAVNFQGDATTAATSKVVVFYGGNDGMLRAINGNRGDAGGVAKIGGKAPGEEMWSFMPPEAYGNVKRLRDNTTLVKLASETYAPGVSTGSKPYGMDGPITAFQGNVGTPAVARTFIYATMRRGGRSIYAFDVSNILTSPSSPTFKWRIGCATALAAASQDCSTGMANIGQTWSSLKPFTTSGHGSGTTNLLVMGGGYDACEDHDGLVPGGANHNCTGTSKGGSVYILDADTGAVVREFSTGKNRGVVADTTLVRDATGQVILGYTADLGGNVYRIKFGSGAAASWTMTHIASLGCDTTAACVAPRKFMFAPSVLTTDTISVDATYYLLLGSGDREKPISYYASSNAVQNWFFQFRDRPGDSTFPGTTDCGASVICLPSLVQVTSTTSPSEPQVQAKKGWALRMASSEQVVTSAVTVFGVTTFSTHRPATATATATATCTSNLGDAKVYNLDYRTVLPAVGDSRSADVSGDGLPPSPVAGQVTLDDGTTVPFCIGCNPDSPLEGKLPPTLAGTIKPKSRLYWYIEK